MIIDLPDFPSVQDSNQVYDVSEGSPKSCLFLHEKLAVCLMLFFLATIATLSFVSKQQKMARSEQTIRVHCAGAISQEIWLELPAGAQIADALAFLTLTKEAALEKLCFQEHLKNNQTLIIPVADKMSLYVAGAVTEPGIIYVPEDCRFNELKQYLTLTEEADASLFRRRRRVLCEGESIYIPTRCESNERK